MSPLFSEADYLRQVVRMVVNTGYVVTEIENIEIVEKKRKEQLQNDKAYSFDESIDLAGNSRYGVSLLAVLSLATMAMGMDLFGFSVVVAGATCDLKLDLHQTSVLLAMPFIGPIVMSYPWGYISDVYGRRKSLLISLWSSFAVSTISAFSPNWVLLAVLRFISTSLSSCAQSATYTLLGESCPRHARDGFTLMMTSVLDFMLAVYIVIAYGILNLEFSVDLILMMFPPWRLLALVLAAFLGLSALGIHFFYESPKFLLNAGREDEALDVLRGIWVRNGGKIEDYPVNKVFLKEHGNIQPRDAGAPLLQSLWRQVAPLFTPPLLWHSLQLYFLTAVAFGTSNPYFVWFPLLAQKFFEGVNSNGGQQGMCHLIISSYKNDTTSGRCSSMIELNVVWSTLAQGLVFVAVLIALSNVAQRKRLIIILILSLSGLCGLGAVLVQNNVLSFLLFFGQLSNELSIGVIYSYFVDLYPTSYRGMATSVGTMVARSSSLAGIYLFGAFVMTHCSHTFYVCTVLNICGVLVSLMLPSDKSVN